MISVSTKKRICVVGLKNNQANVVDTECNDFADLRFLDARRPVYDVPTCDYLVLLPRFIGGGWARAARRSMDRSRVHLHGGGITSLVERIKTLCA
jgi:hypothetical protein